jgi:ankyrin repeat protein
MEDDPGRALLWDAVVQGLPLPQAECSPEYLHMLLRAAIWNEEDAAVAALLDRPAFNAGDDGAFVNLQTPPYKRTLLSLAAFHGRCNAAALLLRAKARVDLKDIYRRDPLSEAACHEDTRTAQLLLAAKALVRPTALLVVALEGRNTDIVRILLGANASINARAISLASPIHFAARAGRASWVQCLAEAKADAAPVDYCDRTPLHVVGLRPRAQAPPEDYVATVRALLGANADVHARSRQGRTPVWSASFKGCGFLVPVLVDAKADADAADAKRTTPLHIASREGHVAAVEALLCAKARPDSVDRKDRTPLMLATRAGRSAAVLRRAGRDKGNRAVVELLVAAKASL